MIHLKPIISFRADGNSEIGLGHLIRTSALADVLKDEYTCVLATRCKIISLISILKASFEEIILLPETGFGTEAQELSKFISPQHLLVLDGYNFDSDYQELLVKQGFDLFSIDDIHAFNFYSKVIINHAGGISPLNYRSFPFTQFYLGPRYALLRSPFLQASENRRIKIKDKNCFVCFGGADPNNKTLEILKNPAIRNFNGFEHFHVVVGGAYNYKAALADFVLGQNITLHNSLSSKQMVELMGKCSFAICSPSTIVYEYMSVGGIVFLEQIADNQSDVIKYFTLEKLAFALKDLNKVNPEQIENAFKKQALYFDGLADKRLIKIFRQYFNTKDLTIRSVGKEDLEICYEWANDPEVRLQSFNNSSIAISDHIEWFNQRLSDSQCFFYILEWNNVPVAQIRFQLKDNEALLSYLAGQAIRSKGLGTAILAKGLEKFFSDYKSPVKIKAFVKSSNLASQLSFEKLAFIREDSAELDNSLLYTMFYGDIFRK